MPVLKDFRKTKTISLPDYEGSEITIYSSLLVSEMGDVPVSDTGEMKMGAIMRVLPKFIQSWNFTNEAGEPLPVTPETVGILNADAMQLIMEAVQELKESVKKK